MMKWGDYQVIKRLAAGGMAEIFLAKRQSVAGFQRLVVIKRILPEYSENPEFVASFLNEARLSAELHHPNIVQIYDLGRINKSYFITMEYVNGYDLGELLQMHLRTKTFMPYEVALRVVCDVCAALDYAHRATSIDGEPLGIVHRDVSPANVIVAREGPAKVLDFGIAKAASFKAQTQEKTKAGTLKGKFSYLSPEQVLGVEDIDRRVDIFATGILLYEMLANTHPFRGPTDYQTLQNIADGKYVPLKKHRPDLPDVVSAVIDKAMARDVEQRFASCADLQAAIEHEARQDGVVLSHASVLNYLTQNSNSLPRYRQLDHNAANDMPSSHWSGLALVPDESDEAVTLDTSEFDEVESEEEDTAFDSQIFIDRSSALAPVVALPQPEIEHARPDLRLVTPPPMRDDGFSGQRPLWRVAAMLAGALGMVLIGGAAFWYLRGMQRGEVARPAAPPSYVLEVNSQPEGAQVLIDGALYTGVTPLEISGLPQDRAVTLELRAQGFMPVQTQVTMSMSRALFLTLAKATPNGGVVVPPPESQIRAVTEVAPELDRRAPNVVRKRGAGGKDAGRDGKDDSPSRASAGAMPSPVIETVDLPKTDADPTPPPAPAAQAAPPPAPAPAAAAPSQPSAYQRVSRAPRLIQGQRMPMIPAEMLSSLRGVKGVIIVKVKIGEGGVVEDVDVVRSTIPVLNEVVKRYIRTEWRFEPSMSGGEPIAVEILQPFSFMF